LSGFFYFNQYLARMKKFTVYVIKSYEGYHYTGMTEDIKRRIKEHNNHSLSFWTKRGTNWQLIYKEDFISKVDALNREKWLKSGVGRQFLKKNAREY